MHYICRPSISVIIARMNMHLSRGYHYEYYLLISDIYFRNLTHSHFFLVSSLQFGFLRKLQNKNDRKTTFVHSFIFIFVSLSFPRREKKNFLRRDIIEFRTSHADLRNSSHVERSRDIMLRKKPVHYTLTSVPRKHIAYPTYLHSSDVPHSYTRPFILERVSALTLQSRILAAEPL